MIELQKDGEYSPTIANLITTLSKMEKFQLHIWVNASELPFKLDGNCDFLFLQESVRIKQGDALIYIFYDIITGIKVIG